MAEAINIENIIYNASLLTEHDIYLFKQGNHFRLYEKLGSHRHTVNEIDGVLFAVWAPNAQQISVVGDFNGWNPDRHPLKLRQDKSGIWEGLIPHLRNGTLYKYHVVAHNYQIQKSDPFAQLLEVPPGTASITWDLQYSWQDSQWMKQRRQVNHMDAPWSIYEIHLGSWRRVPEEQNRFLTYRELAQQLPFYLENMGYTHVQFLPIMEHPFYGSWGYETTGYFAPTSRYGTPQDFMYLIDQLHQRGLGVILDWVPSHFPSDGHGLTYFDGTHLFEHADPKEGVNPEWNSYIFNYGRYEVKSFLISSALFWLDKYHADGIRVDAVASMLYLDYAKKPGEWIPNEYGGRENLKAVEFIRQLNEIAYRDYPDVQTIAEESTSWPMVSRPTYLGGLGFGFKWNMGWMHDTLNYFSLDPIYRKFHHSELTFSLWYAFYENFVLPLSHDEVTQGKGALIGKMPGDAWQKMANLRLLFGYMYGHPGKKLLFMGSEIGQWDEWDHDESLQWHLLQFAPHQGLQNWVKDLNHFYKSEPALYERDFSQDGFEWIDFHDWEESIISFIRKGKNTTRDIILTVCNFTPLPRQNYLVGTPRGGWWKEELNSDAECYGGSGTGNLGGLEAAPIPVQGRYHSLSITLPPLGIVFFKSKGGDG